MLKTGVDKCVGLCWTLRASSTTQGTTQGKHKSTTRKI